MKYTVTKEVLYTYEIEVEAENEDEAVEKSEEHSLDEWKLSIFPDEIFVDPVEEEDKKD